MTSQLGILILESGAFGKNCRKNIQHLSLGIVMGLVSWLLAIKFPQVYKSCSNFQERKLIVFAIYIRGLANL